MQQKIDNGIIFVKADKSEGSMIRSWRMMKWDKDKGFWYGDVSKQLLEKLNENGGLIPPAKKELAMMRRVQDAVDRERVKPDEQVKLLMDVPVKASLYAHQKRAFNMAAYVFGLAEPEETT